MNTPQPMMAPPVLLDSQGRGSVLVMRVMPLPADTNGNGDIFGGWLMAQVDLAGAVLPLRIARGRIATVAVTEANLTYVAIDGLGKPRTILKD